MTSTQPTPRDSDRIDLSNEHDLAAWAKRFDATAEQIREAVEAVGDHPDNVEMHLKGSRSSSNSERVAEETQQAGSSTTSRP